MADLVVPTLGESITEAVIGRWIKDVGETVEADEIVAEIESDKVTMELRSPVAGTLGARAAEAGATVKVGAVVGTVEPGAGGGAAKPKAKEAAKAAPAKAAEPAKAAGDKGDKAALDKAGIPAGDAAGAVKPGEVSKTTAPGNGAGGRAMSPSMRKAQREGKGHAGGGDGAVVVGDAAGTPVAGGPTAARPARPAAPAGAADPREEVVAMSPLRKRIAERLVEAQHSSASLTTFNEVDMSAVIALRERYKQDFVDHHGVKLGFMSFFVKAAIAALELFPGVNAEVRGDSIVYKKHYDLGIAVSTDRGLIVPVLREADRLGFAEVEQGINELAAKARAGKLTMNDLSGGTFTITNGGIYGSMMSTPLLNFPQTGILGMHNIVERAVVIDGKVEVRPMMYLALTYDHRVVDGKEAVSFLVAVKQRIERPDRMLLGV